MTHPYPETIHDFVLDELDKEVQRVTEIEDKKTRIRNAVELHTQMEELRDFPDIWTDPERRRRLHDAAKKLLLEGFNFEPEPLTKAKARYAEEQDAAPT